jgi:hypothetical protein
MVRIQVKSKQDNEWPAIAGLYRVDDFLVLVDFKGKDVSQRPDFYIINLDDWKQLVLHEKRMRSDITIDDQFRVRYPDGWSGLNITSQRVAALKEEWQKITTHIHH